MAVHRNHRIEDETVVGNLPVVQIRHGERKTRMDIAVEESVRRIYLDKERLATLLASPSDPEYLAVGFLYSEGLIHTREDLADLVFQRDTGAVCVRGRDARRHIPVNGTREQVIPSGCGALADVPGGLSGLKNSERIDSHLTLSPKAILELMRKFQRRSRIYRSTGGTHSAALCSKESILVFSEDIGRHNALDKVIGQCVMESISMRDHIILTSGRISTEIVAKIARAQVPVVVSRSAPTMMAVKLAASLKITVVGFVRGRRMNIYTHEERIVSSPARDDTPPSSVDGDYPARAPR